MSQKLKDMLLKNYHNPSFLQNLQLCRLASQRAGEDFLNDIQAETKRVFYRSLLELYVHKGTLFRDLVFLPSLYHLLVSDRVFS